MIKPCILTIILLFLIVFMLILIYKNKFSEHFSRQHTSSHQHNSRTCKHPYSNQLINGLDQDDENTNYQSIYFELHLCIKIILASSFPEHRVNIHQFESLYKRNKNKRYYNPGFLYNSIILGLASRNFKLVTKQFEILSNQVNGKSPISKNLTKILPTLKEGILQSFGLNELDL